MKWFKHETKRKASLKRLIMEFGIEGYGLYMVCIELIAGDLSIDNLTFELEEDAELIAHEFKMDTIKVEKIMHRCIELGLFDLSDSGRLRCLDLAKMLDESISKNHHVKEIKKKISLKLDKYSNSGNIPETIGTPSDQNRIEENRIEENIYYENTYFSIPVIKHDEYKGIFDKIDIDYEYSQMKLWLDDNPSKRKKNYNKFVTNWLKKSYDDYKKNNPLNPQYEKLKRSDYK